MHECLWEYDPHSRPEIFLSFRLLLVFLFFLCAIMSELDSLPFQVCLFYAKWGKVILFSFDHFDSKLSFREAPLLLYHVTTEHNLKPTWDKGKENTM